MQLLTSCSRYTAGNSSTLLVNFQGWICLASVQRKEAAGCAHTASATMTETHNVMTQSAIQTTLTSPQQNWHTRAEHDTHLVVHPI